MLMMITDDKDLSQYCTTETDIVANRIENATSFSLKSPEARFTCFKNSKICYLYYEDLQSFLGFSKIAAVFCMNILKSAIFHKNIS